MVLLTLEYVAKIVRHERPDAIVPGIGGQTGLESGHAAGKKGDSEQVPVQNFWEPASESIEKAEDRATV